MVKLVSPHMLRAADIDAFGKEYKQFASVSVPSGHKIPDMTGAEFLHKRPWREYADNFCFFAMNEIDEVIGIIRLTPTINDDSIKAGTYNIGMAISPSYRVRGYGTEVLGMGLKWLQSFCQGDTAYCAVKCDNDAANRTARAAGGREVTTRTDGFTVWEFRLHEEGAVV